VLDEAQGKVQSQPVAAVAVVGQAHRFEPLTLLFSKFGKNIPKMEMLS
jgi:hypothetical protein